MIYVLKILDGEFIKIGYADDVESRRRSLQGGNPFEIVKLFAIEGTLIQEQQIHRALNQMYVRTGFPRIPNEWYHSGDNRVGAFFELVFFKMLTEGINSAISHIEEYKNWHSFRRELVEHKSVLLWPTRKSLGKNDGRKLLNIHRNPKIWKDKESLTCPQTDTSVLHSGAL